MRSLTLDDGWDEVLEKLNESIDKGYPITSWQMAGDQRIIRDSKLSKLDDETLCIEFVAADGGAFAFESNKVNFHIKDLNIIFKTSASDGLSGEVLVAMVPEVIVYLD